MDWKTEAQRAQIFRAIQVVYGPARFKTQVQADSGVSALGGMGRSWTLGMSENEKYANRKMSGSLAEM